MSRRPSAFSCIHAYGFYTIFLGSILTACGGGASTSGSSDAAETAAPAAQPTTAVATTPVGTSAATAVAPDVSATAAPSAVSFEKAIAGPTVIVPEVGETEAAAVGLQEKAASVTVPANAGYFVDSVSGNDQADGSQATPFRSLSRLASLRLKSGQGIYFHCGGVWRESLNLSATQLVDGSTIAIYGDNCDTAPPRITGAADLSGNWTQSGNIWSKTIPPGTPKISRLFVNGIPMNTAQWPNAAGIGASYKFAAANSPVSFNKLQVAGSDLPGLSSISLAGATIRVRSEPWTLEDRSISSFDPASGVITLNTPSSYGMEGYDGYILLDQAWMLDAPGEFYHDAAKSRIYLVMPTALTQTDLNKTLVEAPIRDYAVTITDRSGIRVQGLNADMAVLDSVVLQNLPNSTASGLTAAHSGRAGVRISTTKPPASGTVGTWLTASTVFDNTQYGIDAQTAAAPIVTSNVVQDTGTLGWTGSSMAAIWGGDGANISSNTIRNATYHGIRFSGSGGSAVTSNIVTSYCLALADCGAIYTWNFPNGSPRTVNQHSTVTSNQIGAATPNPAGSVGSGGTVVAAIYLDDFSMGAVVKQNTVAGSPIGIYLHNSSNHTIDSNRLWLNSDSSIGLNMDRTDRDASRGNVFTNNQLVPATTLRGVWPALPQASVAVGVRYSTTLADSNSISSGVNSFSGNQFVSLQTGSTAAAEVKTSTGTFSYTLGGWQVLSPGDTLGYAPARFTMLNETLGPELQSYGNFTAGMYPWLTYFAKTGTGAFSVQAGVNGCKTSCAIFTASSASDILYGAPFSMNSGTMYSVRYQAYLKAPTRLQAPLLTQSSTPWSQQASAEGLSSTNATSGTANDVIAVESWLHAATTSSSRTNLRVSTLGVAVAFNNVSVKEVNGYKLSQVSDWAGVVQAGPSKPITVDCSSFGWGAACTAKDLSGAVITFPLTLSAGQTRLLVRTDSSWLAQ